MVAKKHKIQNISLVLEYQPTEKFLKQPVELDLPCHSSLAVENIPSKNFSHLINCFTQCQAPHIHF